MSIFCSSDKAEIEWATSVAHLKCGENDPGLAFCFASDAEIHAALAVGVPPVAQVIGNPQQSAHAFKLWLYNTICGIQPLASVPAGAGGPSMEMYHPLTTDEYQQFLNVIMAPPLSTWITAVYVLYYPTWKSPNHHPHYLCLSLNLQFEIKGFLVH
jgi:hypothetical protein